MKNGITIEICAGSLCDVLAAAQVKEIDRIELNCALELGGLTPSAATLKMAKKAVTIPLICMCRPRGAGFIYSDAEKQTMYEDAVMFLENGADGIVFGSLNEDHSIDEVFTGKMADLIHSYGKEAVFHKAFDDAADLFEASQSLIRCGIDRILTSGSKPDAYQGAELIGKLIAEYQGKISFLPGGGVNENNIRDILTATGSNQIHMSAKVTVDQDGRFFAVSSERIRNIIEKI